MPFVLKSCNKSLITDSSQNFSLVYSLAGCWPPPASPRPHPAPRSAWQPHPAHLTSPFHRSSSALYWTSPPEGWQGECGECGRGKDLCTDPAPEGGCLGLRHLAPVVNAGGRGSGGTMDPPYLRQVTRASQLNMSWCTLWAGWYTIH